MWKCPNCETENSDWNKQCDKCSYKPKRDRVNPLRALLTTVIVALVVGFVVWLTVGFGVGPKKEIIAGEIVYVEISDPGMEKAIRQTIDKPEGGLTEAELLDMTILNAEKCGIVHLDDLTKMPNLTHIYLGGNNLSDVSAVTQLTNLTYLNIDENNVSDISFIPQLTNLIEFSANANQIADITPLTGQVDILRLYLEDNLITDITPLTDLRKLLIVWLDGNAFDDYTPLLNKPYLKDLHANDTFYAGNQILKLMD